jgi:formylglycine-generating enzyme required for sulfatase activity
VLLLGTAPVIAAAVGCVDGPGAEPTRPGAKWTNSLGMEFVRIPAGEFVMGTSEADVRALIARFGEEALRLDRIAAEKPRHRVRITRDFLMGRHEVTVGQFRRFVEASNYKTDAERGGGANAHTVADSWEKTPGITWWKPGFKQTDVHPVVCVSWNDAQKFIEWLNAADRKNPKGWAYRLPSEAEWEYAARGAARREYAWGDDWSSARANFADKTSGLGWGDQKIDDGYARTAPVASFSPKGDTPLGLCDMTGNAWEWCQDWFDAAYYQRSPVDDPLNAKPGRTRVERGGSWAFTADYCRAAFRLGLEPAESYDNLGFRVVLAPVGR